MYVFVQNLFENRSFLSSKTPPLTTDSPNNQLVKAFGIKLADT